MYGKYYRTIIPPLPALPGSPEKSDDTTQVGIFLHHSVLENLNYHNLHQLLFGTKVHFSFICIQLTQYYW